MNKMNKEMALERRLEREARENHIATIDKGGPDCAKVEVSYGDDDGSLIIVDGEHTHCGHFIVVCHKVEEWDEEAAGEEYSPYASSEALVREWFEAHPAFCDWWQVDDTYAY